MISSEVVSRYANALVDVVLSPNSGVEPAQAVEQLRAFTVAVQSSAPLRSVLASPAISAPRKRVVIKEIARALSLSTVVRNFVLVLNDHRRAGGLAEIADAFEKILDERLGFLRAEVRSALALSGQQQDELSNELSKVAGSKVRMRFEVDPDLIGGVAARIGSKVYDGSVRGQLTELRQRLAANI